MSTEHKSTTKGPILRLIVAEDLRREVDGKVTAVGLFPDNTVIAHLPKDVPEPTDDSPIMLKSLGFLFNISKLPARKPGTKVTVKIDILAAGQRKLFMAPRELNWPNTGDSMNIMGVMNPCPVGSFGERTFFVTFGKNELSADYEIRRKYVDAPSVGEASSPVLKRRPLPAKRRGTKST